MALNNPLNKKINEELPHDFSICDLDGVIRWNKPYGTIKRLSIYEYKHYNEHLSNTQLDTLKEIDRRMDWRGLDDMSGVWLVESDGRTGYHCHNIRNCRHEYYKDIQEFHKFCRGDLA